MTRTTVTSKFNVVTKLKMSAPLASDESSRVKQEKSIRKSDPHCIQICNFYLYKMIRGFLAKNKGCIWFWSFSLRVLGRFLDHETLEHETDLSSFKNQPRDQNSMGRENHTDYHLLRAKMKGRPGKNDMRSRD